ncbi:MAG: hypothetical protein D6808_05310 [Candidatus Dadabacteria bacterium]|nr:MAG: hypothetical protein D6808_05310 [Candidatus Dadabacteria bacterium]
MAENGDEEEFEEEELNWLERMHPLMEWKVVYPECNSPFGTPMSEKALNELASKKEILIKYLELRARVDGEEIIVIKNLPSNLEVITDHPAVVPMRKSEIKRYLTKMGVMDFVDKEMDNIQEIYRKELKNRKRKKKRVDYI